MHRPRVGIVIRTKDRPLFVTRALKAVLDQTYEDWSVLLVNDGGDQQTLEAAIAADPILAEAPATHAFATSRVTIKHFPRSVGRADAFNLAAQSLETQFVCCLDDDDTWHPEFLQNLVALYDTTKPLAPDLGGVAALVTAIREDIVTRNGIEEIVVLGTEDLPHSFKRTDFFVNPIAYATYRHDLYPVQWLLDRDAVVQAGGFPSVFSVMEDRAFMTRFLQEWRLAILDKPLAFHHRRVQRRDDTVQSAQMNTLDNPSYNWRLYSDLAKIEASALQGHEALAPLNNRGATDLIRASSATVIKELNDETSALWHKINGEAMALRARIDSLEARLGSVAPMQDIETPEADRVWSLWAAVGETDRGYTLSTRHPFVDRFTLTMSEDQPGILFHASPAHRRMVLQVPDTREFTTLNLSLTGLADRDGGLRCEVILSTAEGYLFQTGLTQASRDRLGRTNSVFEAAHVHACPTGGSVKVVRDFASTDLARSASPKFSIVLPRQTNNFGLCCRDLVISRL